MSKFIFGELHQLERFGMNGRAVLLSIKLEYFLKCIIRMARAIGFAFRVVAVAFNLRRDKTDE